jgi:hypothetical protein
MHSLQSFFAILFVVAAVLAKQTADEIEQLIRHNANDSAAVSETTALAEFERSLREAASIFNCAVVPVAVVFHSSTRKNDERHFTIDH